MKDVELAALLCSRLCHDLISPVGALNNGLEVLEEEGDGEMREAAMALIRSSAAQANAKLLFARLAYGTAGGTGGSLELDDARLAAEKMFAFAKPELQWKVPRGPMTKDIVRLLLNLTLLGFNTVPRGGTVSAALKDTGARVRLKVEANGPRAALAANEAEQLTDAGAEADARSIQARYTRLIARALSCEVGVTQAEEYVCLTADIPNAQRRAQAA